MAETRTGPWGAESVARGGEQLYPWQVGNKVVPLGLLLLEGKALSLWCPGSAGPEREQCQSKLGRESLFMVAASSRALKNGLALALW